MIALRNLSGKDVVDFPVAELEINPNTGEILLNREGQPKETGMTYKWTIRNGEALEFPDYVAKYLLQVYGFLDEITAADLVEPEVAPKKVDDFVPEKANTSRPQKKEIKCKYCDKIVVGMNQYGMHLGSKHPDVLR